ATGRLRACCGRERLLCAAAPVRRRVVFVCPLSSVAPFLVAGGVVVVGDTGRRAPAAGAVAGPGASGGAGGDGHGFRGGAAGGGSVLRRPAAFITPSPRGGAGCPCCGLRCRWWSGRCCWRGRMAARRPRPAPSMRPA